MARCIVCGKPIESEIFQFCEGCVDLLVEKVAERLMQKRGLPLPSAEGIAQAITLSGGELLSILQDLELMYHTFLDVPIASNAREKVTDFQQARHRVRGILHQERGERR